MDAVTENTALRVADHLRNAVKTPRNDGSTLRVETIYDPGARPFEGDRDRLAARVCGAIFSALLGAILDA